MSSFLFSLCLSAYVYVCSLYLARSIVSVYVSVQLLVCEVFSPYLAHEIIILLISVIYQIFMKTIKTTHIEFTTVGIIIINVEIISDPRWSLLQLPKSACHQPGLQRQYPAEEDDSGARADGRLFRRHGYPRWSWHASPPHEPLRLGRLLQTFLAPGDATEL